MTKPERFSDELLNAYVDGELAADDVLAIEQAMQQDDLLRERVRELKDIKCLVRDAYIDEKPERASVPLRRRGWMTGVAAYAATFVLGIALSWAWFSYMRPDEQRIASAPSYQTNGPVQTAEEVKVVFHLSRDDPARLNDVLTEAEALLTKTAQLDREAAVRIIVSGSGLALLEKGSAPNPERISALKRSYRDQIVFNACGVAYKQFKSRETDGEFQLLPEVQLVDLGVLELMRRQQAGWAYIRL